MVIPFPVVRVPARRPLEDVRRRVVGGWDDFDPWFSDGLTPSDRLDLALDSGGEVIPFPCATGEDAAT